MISFRESYGISMRVSRRRKNLHHLEFLFRILHSLLLIQHNLPQPHTRRGDLYNLVIRHVTQGLLQIHYSRRGKNDFLICRRRADVG
jgi:hypothetical protein